MGRGSPYGIVRQRILLDYSYECIATGATVDSLDEVLAAARANPGRAVFISRNGTAPQPALAVWIAGRLQAHGYIPILQDLHFRNTNFMLAMDAALATGARVMALLSKEYPDYPYASAMIWPKESRKV